ncbi:hypothetical protein Ahy_B05g076199 [Arachis hypogaea]|uniref:SWIM-type domain-containing protein n=1 Tax=Arachis hypogaea TaxID=3818 RepID=A0A444Z2T0_ARAHY|nr:hypothetical protein Ahy_B05g076199 [Arachis hypogaea]
MPGGRVLVVDLARQRCDYGHFQVERLPCHHVIACCANQCLDWQVYVGDVYKMSEIHKVYRIEFVLLCDTETWPGYSGPTMVANPALRRTSKGRPKSTHYLNETDSQKMHGPWVCRLWWQWWFIGFIFSCRGCTDDQLHVPLLDLTHLLLPEQKDQGYTRQQPPVSAHSSQDRLEPLLAHSDDLDRFQDADPCNHSLNY